MTTTNKQYAPTFPAILAVSDDDENCLILGEVGAGCDGDFLCFMCGLIVGGDVQDAVGINVKRDLNLWHAAGCRGDPIQMETTE